MNVLRALCGMMLTVPLTLAAQSPSMSDTAQLATITTDTGALAPGHHDFAKYTTLTLCLIAVKREITVGRRSLAARVFVDTLQDRTRDTLPARAAQVARACSARFTLPTTATKDLHPLFELALLAGNDSLTSAIQQRILAASPTAADRVTRQMQFVDEYLQAEPARLATAKVLVAQLDTLYAKDFANRILAHVKVLDYAAGSYWSGTVWHDTVLARREAEYVIDCGHSVPIESFQRGDSTAKVIAWGVNYAFDILEKLALYEARGSGDGIIAVAERAKKEFQRFMVDGKFPLPVWRSALGERPVITALTPIDSVVFGLYWTAYGALYASQDTRTPFPRLRADFWFPAVKGDSLQPERGRISDYKRFLRSFGYSDDGRRPELDEITEELKEGVKVTEWFVIGAGTSMFGGQLSPSAEAEEVRWYLQDYMHLPVNVAGIVDTVEKLQEPDGRLIFKNTDLCDSSILVQCDSASIEKWLLAAPDGGWLQIAAGTFKQLHSSKIKQ